MKKVTAILLASTIFTNSVSAGLDDLIFHSKETIRKRAVVMLPSIPKRKDEQTRIFESMKTKKMSLVEGCKAFVRAGKLKADAKPYSDLIREIFTSEEVSAELKQNFANTFVLMRWSSLDPVNTDLVFQHTTNPAIKEYLLTKHGYNGALDLNKERRLFLESSKDPQARFKVLFAMGKCDDEDIVYARKAFVQSKETPVHLRASALMYDWDRDVDVRESVISLLPLCQNYQDYEGLESLVKVRKIEHIHLTSSDSLIPNTHRSQEKILGQMRAKEVTLEEGCRRLVQAPYCTLYEYNSFRDIFSTVFTSEFIPEELKEQFAAFLSVKHRSLEDDLNPLIYKKYAKEPRAKYWLARFNQSDIALDFINNPANPVRKRTKIQQFETFNDQAVLTEMAQTLVRDCKSEEDVCDLIKLCRGKLTAESLEKVCDSIVLNDHVLSTLMNIIIENKEGGILLRFLVKSLDRLKSDEDDLHPYIEHFVIEGYFDFRDNEILTQTIANPKALKKFLEAYLLSHSSSQLIMQNLTAIKGNPNLLQSLPEGALERLETFLREKVVSELESPKLPEGDLYNVENDFETLSYLLTSNRKEDRLLFSAYCQTHIPFIVPQLKSANEVQKNRAQRLLARLGNFSLVVPEAGDIVREVGYELIPFFRELSEDTFSEVTPESLLVNDTQKISWNLIKLFMLYSEETAAQAFKHFQRVFQNVKKDAQVNGFSYGHHLNQLFIEWFRKSHTHPYLGKYIGQALAQIPCLDEIELPSLYTIPFSPAIFLDVESGFSEADSVRKGLIMEKIRYWGLSLQKDQSRILIKTLLDDDKFEQSVGIILSLSASLSPDVIDEVVSRLSSDEQKLETFIKALTSGQRKEKQNASLGLLVSRLASAMDMRTEKNARLDPRIVEFVSAGLLDFSCVKKNSGLVYAFSDPKKCASFLDAFLETQPSSELIASNLSVIQEYKAVFGNLPEAFLERLKMCLRERIAKELETRELSSESLYPLEKEYNALAHLTSSKHSKDQLLFSDYCRTQIPFILPHLINPDEEVRFEALRQLAILGTMSIGNSHLDDVRNEIKGHLMPFLTGLKEDALTSANAATLFDSSYMRTSWEILKFLMVHSEETAQHVYPHFLKVTQNQTLESILINTSSNNRTYGFYPLLETWFAASHERPYLGKYIAQMLIQTYKAEDVETMTLAENPFSAEAFKAFVSEMVGLDFKTQRDLLNKIQSWGGNNPHEKKPPTAEMKTLLASEELPLRQRALIFYSRNISDDAIAIDLGTCLAHDLKTDEDVELILNVALTLNPNSFHKIIDSVLNDEKKLEIFIRGLQKEEILNRYYSQVIIFVLRVMEKLPNIDLGEDELHPRILRLIHAGIMDFRPFLYDTELQSLKKMLSFTEAYLSTAPSLESINNNLSYISTMRMRGGDSVTLNACKEKLHSFLRNRALMTLKSVTFSKDALPPLEDEFTSLNSLTVSEQLGDDLLINEYCKLYIPHILPHLESSDEGMKYRAERQLAILGSFCRYFHSLEEYTNTIAKALMPCFEEIIEGKRGALAMNIDDKLSTTWEVLQFFMCASENTTERAMSYVLSYFEKAQVHERQIIPSHSQRVYGFSPLFRRLLGAVERDADLVKYIAKFMSIFTEFEMNNELTFSLVFDLSPLVFKCLSKELSTADILQQIGLYRAILMRADEEDLSLDGEIISECKSLLKDLFVRYFLDSTEQEDPTSFATFEKIYNLRFISNLRALNLVDRNILIDHGKPYMAKLLYSAEKLLNSGEVQAEDKKKIYDHLLTVAESIHQTELHAIYVDHIRKLLVPSLQTAINADLKNSEPFSIEALLKSSGYRTLCLFLRGESEYSKQSLEVIKDLLIHRGAEVHHYGPPFNLSMRVIYELGDLIGHDHPFMEEALDIAGKHNLSDDKSNPIWRHKHLLKEREKEVKHRTQPQQLSDGRVVSLNLKKLNEPVKNVPALPVTHKDLLSLGDSLLAELKENESAVLEFKELFPDRDAHILIGALHDKFFRDLVDEKEGEVKKKPSLVSRKLREIVTELKTLEKTKEGLSPASKLLVQLLLNVQTCTTGKEGGIDQSYSALGKKAFIQEGQMKIERLKEIITELLLEETRKIRDGILIGDGKLVRKLVGVKGSVDEPPHQYRYLMGLIGEDLTLTNEKPLFDHNMGCVNEKLIEMEKQTVLDTFYEFFTPEFLIESILRRINGKELVLKIGDKESPENFIKEIPELSPMLEDYVEFENPDDDMDFTVKDLNKNAVTDLLIHLGFIEVVEK